MNSTFEQNYLDDFPGIKNDDWDLKKKKEKTDDWVWFPAHTSSKFGVILRMIYNQ